MPVVLPKYRTVDDCGVVVLAGALDINYDDALKLIWNKPPTHRDTTFYEILDAVPSNKLYYQIWTHPDSISWARIRMFTSAKARAMVFVKENCAQGTHHWALFEGKYPRKLHCSWQWFGNLDAHLLEYETSSFRLEWERNEGPLLRDFYTPFGFITVVP